MTSFDLRLEPGPAPRLAAIAALVHFGAAASPWLLGVPAPLAAGLTAAALAGLASTLAGIPGRHHAVDALVADRHGWRVRLAGAADFVPATLGSRSRAIAGLAFVDVRTGSRRHAWLLGRGSLPAGPFRRLKARIRFSC
jgi:hypothetical protein